MKITTRLFQTDQTNFVLGEYLTPSEGFMPGTKPMSITVKDARALISMFEKVDGAHCLANGSTLWVYTEWCELQHIPYSLELHHVGMTPTAWIIRKIQL